MGRATPCRDAKGGGVVAQLLVTISVFAMFLYKTPTTPWGIIMAAAVLILSPWVPAVAFGFGDTIMASIVFVNVVREPDGSLIRRGVVKHPDHVEGA